MLAEWCTCITRPTRGDVLIGGDSAMRATEEKEDEEKKEKEDKKEKKKLSSWTHRA